MNIVVSYATFVTGLQLENKALKAMYVALFNYTRKFVSGILLPSVFSCSSSSFTSSASLMDFSQSVLFSDLSFQFLILHLLLSVHRCTICLLVVLLFDYPGDYY